MDGESNLIGEGDKRDKVDPKRTVRTPKFGEPSMCI